MGFSTEEKGAFIQFLKDNHIKYGNGWKNYSKNVNNPVAFVVEITKDKQLIAIMNWLKKTNATHQPGQQITIRGASGWRDRTKNPCYWKDQAENRYNESFSLSEVVGGRAIKDGPGTDIIIRFSKKYQQVNYLGTVEKSDRFLSRSLLSNSTNHLIEVRGNMRIAELSDKMRESGVSFPTVSMISYVSLQGLTATGGHGTGIGEPALSGLIEEVTICDMNGEMRTLTREHKDFETLMGANLGMMGIITRMVFRGVDAFNLKEEVELFTDTEHMTADMLQTLLQNNQYFSGLGIPTTLKSEQAKKTPKWQIRLWNKTNELPTISNKPLYHADSRSFLQQFNVNVGDWAMNLIAGSELKDLFPHLMLFAAQQEFNQRGTKTIVGHENCITHHQVGFPEKMRDVDVFITVKHSRVGEVLWGILHQIESMKLGQTYAIYIRCLHGTSGGLSTTRTTNEFECVIALDIVGLINDPDRPALEQELMEYFKKRKLDVRMHLGKEFTPGINCYSQFLRQEDIDEFQAALTRWYNADPQQTEQFDFHQSPFVTPFLNKMLAPAPVMEQKKVRTVKEGRELLAVEPEVGVSTSSTQPEQAPIHYDDATKQDVLQNLKDLVKRYNSDDANAKVLLAKIQEHQQRLEIPSPAFTQ